MKNKLGFRELSRIIRDTRGEADRPVEIALAGQPADLVNLKAFLGPGSERIVSVIGAGAERSPTKDTDMVIIVLSGTAPIGPDLTEVGDDCRAFGLETLVLIDGIELNEPTRAAKQVEAEIAFDLSPGRVRFFSPEMVPGQMNELLHYILDRVPEKELAIAAQLPIVRPLVVNDIINRAANENGIIGVTNFFPGTDLPLLTANQMRMVLKIAGAFGITLSLSRARELLFVLGGGFMFRAIARQIAGLVPIAGWAVKGAVAYSGTQTIGLLASRYFEGLSE